MGNNCPQCGAPLEGGARACRYCGYTLPAQAPQPQAVQRPAAPPQYVQRPYVEPYTAPPYSVPPQYPPRPAQPPYAQPYYPPPYTQPIYNQKSKVAAGLLALFLGGIGIHKFYLNKPGQGILYILFCWTLIPSFIALIEGIVYLTCSDEQFNMRYVRH